MTEKEKIMEILEKNVHDVKEQKLLEGICQEIFDEYDKGSVKAVSELIQRKITPLKQRFDEAHTMLLNKMGL